MAVHGDVGGIVKSRVGVGSISGSQDTSLAGDGCGHPVRANGGYSGDGRVGAIHQIDVGESVHYQARGIAEQRRFVRTVGAARDSSRTGDGGRYPVGPYLSELANRVEVVVRHIEVGVAVQGNGSKRAKLGPAIGAIFAAISATSKCAGNPVGTDGLDLAH